MVYFILKQTEIVHLGNTFKSSHSKLDKKLSILHEKSMKVLLGTCEINIARKSCIDISKILHIIAKKKQTEVQLFQILNFRKLS